MKLSVNVTLLKVGRTKKDALKISEKPNYTEIALGKNKADFYWKTRNKKPRWVGLFEECDEVDAGALAGKGVQGLLVLEIRERVMCVTFGHARHMIDQLSIERNFGLKVAVSLTDQEMIKSIDKATIDTTPLRSKSQASKNVKISEFDFKFDWEILKSLTGVVESEKEDEEYELVSGSDSVCLYTEISLKNTVDVCDRVLRAYESNKYKEKFPWIDYIVPIRDKGVISNLDEKVVSMINNKDYSETWIAPPKIIDYESFSGFCYKKTSGSASNPISPEINLKYCIRDKKKEGEVDVKWLKNTSVYLMSSDDSVLEAWPLYLCLNSEVEDDNNLYLLNEGDWYAIEKSFSDRVNKYFKEMKRSDISFPNYKGKTEGEYLKWVCNNKKLIYMDKKLVRPNGASSSIEFCDILTNKKDLIHVKKYSSSSVLSHLFSQAYVSAEILVMSPEVVEQVNERIKENKGCDYVFVFNSKKQPREERIVLAIMQDREGDLHLPFFSKVNLKQYSQKLESMGFSVEVAKINI